MKINRRIFIFLMIVSIVLSCTACGKQVVNDSADNSLVESFLYDNESGSNSSLNKEDFSSSKYAENSSNVNPVKPSGSSDIVSSKPSTSSDKIQTGASSVLPSEPSDFVSSEIIVTDSDRPKYKPTSLTVNFYNTAESSYGFTWNTEFMPLKPVIQICEGTTFNEGSCQEFAASVKTELVNMPRVTLIYFSKVKAVLKPGTTYTYRAYDKGAEIGSSTAVFRTADFNASAFSFVHVSDSQVTGSSSDTDYTGAGTGKAFGDTLSGIFQNKPSFLLHTGDIVEYSKYETYWKNMLDFNGKFIRELPFMPISGNHETTYRSGSNEIFKHFNLKIPNQETKYGFYYAFDYGQVKFIMLNTNKQESDGLTYGQYNWLVDTLKNNNKKWVIVSMHHPMYSVGKWGANPSENAYSLSLRKQLTKLFAEYKVDLVLQGHDHTYSKTYPIKADGTADLSPTYETKDSIKYIVNPKGVTYSMHGTAGTQTRSPYKIDKNLFEIAAASKVSSWADIKVESDRLTVNIMYYKDGKPTLFDSYGIIKK